MNARELSIAIWTGLSVVGVFALAARNRSLRESILTVLRTVLTPAIVIPMIIYVSWIALALWATLPLPLWHPDLAFEFVWWCLTVGVVALFSASSAKTDEDLIGGLLVAALATAVSVDSLVNLAVLPLPVEIVLVPFATFVVLIGVVAKLKPETAQVSRFADGCMATIGIGMMALILLFALTGRVDWLLELRAVVLPFWLTLWVIPLVWVVYLWLRYDAAFRWIGFELKGNEARRVKIALLIRCRWKADGVRRFRGAWVQEAADSKGIRATVQVVSKYLDWISEPNVP